MNSVWGVLLLALGGFLGGGSYASWKNSQPLAVVLAVLAALAVAAGVLQLV